MSVNEQEVQHKHAITTKICVWIQVRSRGDWKSTYRRFCRRKNHAKSFPVRKLHAKKFCIWVDTSQAEPPLDRGRNRYKNFTSYSNVL